MPTDLLRELFQIDLSGGGSVSQGRSVSWHDKQKLMGVVGKVKEGLRVRWGMDGRVIQWC